MFGDEAILGSRSVKVDAKGRIILPSFTGAEAGDRLVLFKKEHYALVAMRDYLDHINSLRVKGCVSSTDFIADLEMLEEYCQVLRTCECDEQHRISCGDIFPRNKAVRVIGARKCAILMTEQEYIEKHALK